MGSLPCDRGVFTEAELKLIEDSIGERDGHAAIELVKRVRDARFEVQNSDDDWRMHVPDGVKELWHTLGLEAQLVAYVTADELAQGDD